MSAGEGSHGMSDWQPLETCPMNDTTVLRPHLIWGAMDVRWKPEGRKDGHRFPWMNGDYTHAWPSEAFLPYWMPLPPPPETP